MGSNHREEQRGFWSSGCRDDDCPGPQAQERWRTHRTRTGYLSEQDAKVLETTHDNFEKENGE